jgi:hypothetical protein
MRSTFGGGGDVGGEERERNRHTVYIYIMKTTAYDLIERSIKLNKLFFRRACVRIYFRHGTQFARRATQSSTNSD